MSRRPSPSTRIGLRLMALMALAAGIAAGVRAKGLRAGARRPGPGRRDSQPGGLPADDPSVAAIPGSGTEHEDAPAGVPADTPAELLPDPDVIQSLDPFDAGAADGQSLEPGVADHPSTRIRLRLLMALVALAAGIAAVVVTIDLVRTVL
jgi:hypothetical protein